VGEVLNVGLAALQRGGLAGEGFPDEDAEHQPSMTSAKRMTTAAGVTQP